MLIPIYKKRHKKKKIKGGINKFLNTVSFGFYGIRSLSINILLFKHLELIRLLVSRCSKKISKLFIRIFFLQPLTRKPLNSRMGKGVGVIKSWVAYVKKGCIFVEITNISTKLAITVFKKLRFNLNLKLNFVSRKIFNY